MHEPNVVGDWQEYDAHTGLRVRVHRLEATEPPRGRDDAAAGLTYFSVRVTVENRGSGHSTIHLEDGQIDVRIGPDGEAAFIAWRNSQFIEGLAASGTTVVFATHDVAEAERHAHRVLVLADGELLFDGLTAELKGSPEDDFETAFVRFLRAQGH